LRNVRQRNLVLVLSVLLIAFPMAQKPESCQAITDFLMEVMPRKVGAAATYRFIFSIEQKWEVHDDIILIWPPGTTINPPIPSNEHDKKQRLTQIIESMSIGLSPCSACQGLPVIDKLADGSVRMVFKTHIGIDPEFPGYNPVIITVPDVCGFTNPRKEGSYIYRLATQSEPTLIKCEPFSIVTSRLGDPEGIPTVIVDPPVFNQPASYQISFQVGRGGWLKLGMGMIKIRFPEGTKLSLPPSKINPSCITVNGKPLLKPPNGTTQILNFPTPVEIQDSGNVDIQIKVDAGIINPPAPGEYNLEVASSGDPDWVMSEPYWIVAMVSDFHIIPPKVNRIAEYILTFHTLEMALMQDSTIDIIFPDNVVLPESINHQAVIINDVPSKSIQKVDQLVQITIHQTIQPQTKIKIRFLKELGIRNPAQESLLFLTFKTSIMDDVVTTKEVLVDAQKLEVGDIVINPPYAYELASYQISIIFGDQALPMSGDLIIVAFSFSDEPIVIKVTEDLPQEYVLDLPSIRNPEPGSYHLKVSTTIETDPAVSKPFLISAKELR
jgi:hypothetical protein